MSETSRSTADPSTASVGTPRAPEVSVGTDAAYGPAAANGLGDRCGTSLRYGTFFRTNEVPIYFIGATPFNLLGLDRWIRNFSYVTYYDGWDGAHPRVFTQAQAVHRIRKWRGDQQLAAGQP